MTVKLSLYRWAIDKNYKYVGDQPEYCLVCGNSVEEVNKNIQELRNNNDVTKFTPWQFDRVVDLEVN